MPTYYKQGKVVTAFNDIALDKVSTFLNGGAALTARYSIEQPPGEVLFKENPKYAIEKRGDKTTKSYIVGYGPGDVSLPAHPVRSGFWLNYAGTSCATATTTHDILERTAGPYYFAMKGAMKHTTTAQNLNKDALGCYMTRFHWEWGQDKPLTAAHTIRFSQLVNGNNTTRTTDLDAKGAFIAGNVSYNCAYNSTSFGATILGGSIDIDLSYKEVKGGSTYLTDAIFLGRDYTLTLDVALFNNALFSVPKDVLSYATAITSDIKWWRASKTTDFMRASFTNLRLDWESSNLGIKKIDEETYIYTGSVIFKNSGTTAGNLIFKVADSFSAGKYESA